VKPFYNRIFLFLLFFLSAYAVSGQTASFTEDYVSGCAPLVVHFSNTSSGATSYSWNLGNGVITALTDPSTSYLTAGTYTVTLTAYSGSSSNTHSVIITVYPTPTVNFYASDTAVCMGEPVTFTSTTSSGVAGPLTYSWNFGDGTSSTASGPTHIFPAPGYYNITLSATNSQGCVSSLTKTVYIHVLAPPIASFTASTTYVCNPPGSVMFTNTSTGTAPFTCTWTFGDGGTGTGISPSHTYTTDGSYTVTLVVTDANGCKDSVTIPSYIYVGSVNAAFTGPSTACVNSWVTFTNTSSTHTSSSWTFGDGGTSTLDNGIHFYTTPGTYTVTLVVWDGPCNSTITHTITILPAAVASFSVSASCPPPSPATFTATVPPGSSVVWHYGDGTTGTGTPSVHTYAACGTYTVSMVVTNSSGCTDTIYQTYTSYNMGISINHDSIPSGCVPLTVRLACLVWTDCPVVGAYPYAITSYTWSFGDGSPTVSAGAVVMHTYTAVGTYTTSVYITTANGCVDTVHSFVLVGTPPVADFTAIPTTICFGLPDTFLNTSTGATSYEWLFGDGGTSPLADPTYVYTEPGIFTVTLIAYNNGCPDTMIRTLYLTVDSPKAIIVDKYLCIPDNAVTFGDSSLGDNTHLWIFGDGTTSTADTLTHTFPALTTYTVSLTTYNTASGCRDTDKVVIDLTRPVLSFTATDTTICRDQWVFMTPTVTGGPAVTGYYWYRNGLIRDNDTSVVYLDTFHVTGLYTIKLIIEDAHNCFDTLTKPNYIHVAKPVASFTEAPPSGCVRLLVNFTDNTTDLAGVPLTNFAWTYGDGATASVGVVSVGHTYTAAGTYAVTEIVTDGYGCKDTATGTVNAYRPVASFNAVPTYPCVGATVNFNNTSTGAASSSWRFGDGGTSAITSPTHIYTIAGTYTVMLIVTDIHGCSDTATFVNYITVTQPTAAFSESDSFSICPPLSELFTNLSTGAAGYYWTFGDGNSSTNVSPGNLYITSGSYTITLVASNLYGCKDTAVEHIVVYGYAGGFNYTPDTGCAPLTVYFTSTITNVPFIIWDFGDGSTSSNTSTEDTVHTYTLPGAYVPKLILSDNTGCQNSSLGADTIKVDAVTAGFKTTNACLGDSVNFIDSSTSYWSTIKNVLWSFGTYSTSVTSPTYYYGTAGTYSVTLTATDQWGCSTTITESVIIYPPPTITASPDTLICVGDKATLTGYGGVSYVWSPPATLSCTACNPTEATTTVVTTYTVVGTDAHGCVNSDTVTVFLKTQTVSVAHGDTAVCYGTKVQIWDSGATKFTWMPPTGLSSSTISDPLADPNVTTTYTVTAQLGSCAPDINYVTIIVYPLPTVNAGDDQTLIAGSTAQLNATGTNIYTYSWSPDETLSCSTCANPVASMSVTTTYIVDVTSNHDCRNSDSVTIHLYCSSSQIFIPNSFTPNGDGQNDVFYPRGTGISNIKSFRIYNRWGELLFERTNIAMNDESNAWDGTFGGATPRPDVYVYIVDAICETGEPIFIKGDVTIIR
jgi:gliding motility-associated-like protein